MTVFLVFLATAGSSPRSMFNEVPTSQQVGRVPVKNTGIPSLAARRCSKVDQRQKMSKEPLLHSHHVEMASCPTTRKSCTSSLTRSRFEISEGR